MTSTEITRLRNQHQAGQWPQYLERIEISGLRGWTGQGIVFKFPVCAVVGENGTGKSTVLKVAAAAYDPDEKYGYYPSDFFLNTHWDRISGVTLGYRIKIGDESKSFSIRKPTKRWSFPNKRFKRRVFWFDVARTLPLDATAGYARVARLAAGESDTESLSEDYREKLSYILGREYQSARFASPDVNEKREVGLLGRDFGEISQFHQGAGEDTTLDLIRALQDVPKYSLVIIDEIEASLHPRAQRRLIRFLLEFCREKRTQIILSTHSPYVLEELPSEARVLLMPTYSGPNVIYGASPEFALSKLDDVVHPEGFLYVEDRRSATWLREILAQHGEGSDLLSRVGIRPVGPANVVQVMGNLAVTEKLDYPGLGVLDGDMDIAQGCFGLPGTKAPEQVVFTDLQAAGWPNMSERFGIGAGNLLTYLEDAMLNADFRKWPALVGDRVTKSATSVWELLATEWCRECLSEDYLQELVDTVIDMLDPRDP